MTAREVHEEALRAEVVRLRDLLLLVAPQAFNGVIAIPFPLACLESVPRDAWMENYLAVIIDHLRSALWAITQASQGKSDG